MESILNKLFISNFDYSYEKMSQSFLSEFCGVDSLSSETYIFQPMYQDYSLEPIFVFHNGSSKYLADCLISKNIRTVEIDTDLKIGISECYFSESETKDCMQFVRDVFNSDLN